MRANTVVASRYRIERLLGRGGMGEVWAARHVGLDTRVAIKFLRAESATEEHAARFRREARAIARLRGDHVVGILDFGVEEGVPYLVMEHVEGETLAARLARTGPLPVELAARLVMDACLALAEAHALGIVHRDLKPQNLFCAALPGGLVSLRVLDFGVATRGLGQDTVTRTAADALLGSPAYMSPEQIRDPHGVDGRADVWALGVTLFEILAGERPFDAFTAQGVIAAIVTDAPRSLAAKRPDLPRPLVALVEAALVKDREARLASVAALAAGLAPYVPDGEARARAVGVALAQRPPDETLDDGRGTTTSDTADAGGRWLGEVARSQPGVTISRVGVVDPLEARAGDAKGRRVLPIAVVGAVAVAALGFAVSRGGGSEPPKVLATPASAAADPPPAASPSSATAPAPSSAAPAPSAPASRADPGDARPAASGTRGAPVKATATAPAIPVPPAPATTTPPPSAKGGRVLPDPDTLGGRN